VNKKGEERGLDLADEKAAFCSKLLADLGARVIKVERPGGDPSRWAGPFPGGTPHPEKSFSFLYNNTNKLGITLNLEHPEGRELFLRLIKKTDVLVESFSPGHLRRLGLGFESLSKANPGLVMASVTGFGQTGPRKDFKTCDLVASAFGGQMSVTGAPEGPPLKTFGDQSYLTGSLFAAVGILLALQKRRKTGTGEYIDISLQETAVSTLDHVITRYFHDQVISRRVGSRHWNEFFWILRCKDGYIHMTPFEQWETLIEWMDSEGMARDLPDEKYKDEQYRIQNADHIYEVLEAWTKRHRVNELFELGQLMRFPWAPVSSIQDVLASPQLKAREFFKNIGDVRYPGLPYRFSGERSGPGKRAPRIGEHNRKIYGEELGLDEKDLTALSSRGII
jgi:crotonobetainyl-CoA:carnitine CoA-transferase CaiB-like acyl-CoA transferase